MKTLTVNVTKEDLHGNPGNPTDCPVFRALNRADPRVKKVAIGDFFLNDVLISLPVRVSRRIGEMIGAHCTNLSIPEYFQPFSFTVEVPD